MSQSICPYLGTLDKADHAGPPVDYPSFENQCFALHSLGDMEEPLLLAEQAAICLSSGHRACPHFRRAQQVAPGVDKVLEELDPFTASNWVKTPDPPSEETFYSRRPWAWAGAMILFVTMLLCGGIFAAYTGWQMVSANYQAERIGSITTIGNGAAPAQEPVYLIVTATSVAANQVAAPQVIATATLVVVPPTLALVGAFPAAVTPTPIVINPAVTGAQPLTASNVANPVGSPAQVLTTTQPAVQLQPPDVNLPTPALDLQVEIPTRRPTPVFDVPTSTPTPLEPTATPTPTPLLGTPVVQFAPLQYALESGQCTLLRWRAENVREVYYENQGVPGIGEREVCMDDEDDTYRLSVILPDGSSKTYTATLTYLEPTPTQTPTPSFTPEKPLDPTPTWTPNAPTATPTPPTIYGTVIEVFGDNYRACAAGSTCDFSFLVTNSGNTPDTLQVTLVQAGPWPSIVCIDGGDCSSGGVALSSVGAGGTKVVTLKVSITADATLQTASYALQSASLGGGVTSGVAAVEVEVK